MTIKVIERGPSRDDQVFRETCEFCMSVVEFEGRDGTPRQTTLNNFFVVECPVCGCTVFADLSPAAHLTEPAEEQHDA